MFLPLMTGFEKEKKTKETSCFSYLQKSQSQEQPIIVMKTVRREVYVCNLFNGSDGKVVEEIPGLMSDTFFTLVVAFTGEHVCNKVASGLLVADVADTCHQFIAHDVRLTGHVRLQ